MLSLSGLDVVRLGAYIAYCVNAIESKKRKLRFCTFKNEF